VETVDCDSAAGGFAPGCGSSVAAGAGDGSTGDGGEEGSTRADAPSQLAIGALDGWLVAAVAEAAWLGTGAEFFAGRKETGEGGVLRARAVAGVPIAE